MRLLATFVGAIVALVIPVLSRAVVDTQKLEVIDETRPPACGFIFSKSGLQGLKLATRGDELLHQFHFFRSVVVELSM